MYRFITAPQIHNGKQWLPKQAVIVVKDGDTIEDVLFESHPNHLEVFEGVITPGWVNAHCHVELSHLKDVIPKHIGLKSFLQQVVQARNNATEEDRKEAAVQAAKALYHNGTNALGDIANTTDAIAAFSQSRMLVHTFIEAIGFDDARADKSFAHALQLQSLYNKQRHSTSIVAHAPYSVSKALFQLIGNAAQPGISQTIHNQEWVAENELYHSKTGEAMDLLRAMNVPTTSFLPSGKSSLLSYLPYYRANQKLILVHNTYTTSKEIEEAMQSHKELWFCLCPNANLYIENVLPAVAQMAQLTDRICIGTDSLASNNQLDILTELTTLKHYFPTLTWEQLIKWGTYNGAEALHMQAQVGSIAKGMKPGLLHLSALDTNHPIAHRIL